MSRARRISLPASSSGGNSLEDREGRLGRPLSEDREPHAEFSAQAASHGCGGQDVGRDHQVPAQTCCPST